MAAEQKLAFDWDGFKKAMLAHGEASGKISHSVMDAKGPIDTIKKAQHESEFLGYETTESGSQVKFIVVKEQLVDEHSETGEQSSIIVVLDRSPFYGEKRRAGR